MVWGGDFALWQNLGKTMSCYVRLWRVRLDHFGRKRGWWFTNAASLDATAIDVAQRRLEVGVPPRHATG
jgi:hypothetical protein